MCSLCSFCDSLGSYIVCLYENMVKPVQNVAILCRVLQKTLSKLERV